MTVYVAFLRGIMPMNPNMHGAKLRATFEKIGLRNVRTVIASGNVIFESGKSAAVLEALIEKTLPVELGFSSTTMIRSEDEIRRLIARDPFKRARGKPNVTFFKKPPAKTKLPQNGKGFTGYGLVSRAFCFTVDTAVVKTPEAMLTLEREFGKAITTRTFGTVLRVMEKMGKAAKSELIDGGVKVKRKPPKEENPLRSSR